MSTVTKTQTFSQHLKSTLTKEVYDNLTTELDLTARKLTLLKRNPERGTIEKAVQFAQLLECTTKQLIDDFGFGLDGISVGDYKKLS